MNRSAFTALAALALLAVAVAAYIVFRPQGATPPAEPTGGSAEYPIDSVSPVTPAPAPAASAASEVLVSEPAASAASDMAAQEPPLPALDASDGSVSAALTQLLGKPAVLSMLQTDGFLRRVVATVDNLGRTHAPSRLWPVNPTPGRFSVDDQGRIAAGNAARYAPLLTMLTGTDPAAIAALYRRHYPSGLRRYVTRLGLGAAKRLFLLAEAVDAATLARIGYLDECVAPAALDATVQALTDALAANAPLAVRGMKASLNEVAAGDADPAVLAARVQACADSADLQEGLRAFAERRAPAFLGR